MPAVRLAGSYQLCWRPVRRLVYRTVPLLAWAFVDTAVSKARMGVWILSASAA